MTKEQKEEIDGMSHYELCSVWRFAESGHHLLRNDDGTGDYFKKKLFEEKGGFTPEISKSLGWQEAK